MSNYTVDRTKWQKLSIFDQMGNIYSEVGRTFSAKQAGDEKRAQEATARALDLFDATAEKLAADNSPKLREVLRVREIFVDESKHAQTTSLDNYLMQFAVAARTRQFK
ncbi:hypothetical protein A3D14_01370 [Candidatus Saccharibacteria bacterium RIFCSPHIGHO2_02_FULL_47_12]|nr:MAG: hypothetical protein A3D14_01370 [Candidatus Saccharibacteria bacterium RIFCSPHIGHO2_02_FULL_47_12]